MKLEDFARQKLSDPVSFSILKTEAIMLAKDFFDQPGIKESVIKKMERGRKEHNQHLSRKQWLEEMADEHKDLLGYLLLRDYYNEEDIWASGQ